MNALKGLVLTSGALALLAGAAWWCRSVPAPVAAGKEPSIPAPAAIALGAVPRPANPEANKVLDIARLLGSPKEPAELYRSRQREAQDRAAALVAVLKARPDAWAPVYELLCCLPEQDVAVGVARLLRDAVDASQERRLAEALRTESNPQARRITLTLMAGRPSSESLAVLQAMAGDQDPRVRRIVLEGLASRRGEGTGGAESTLAQRAQVEPDPVLHDMARILSSEPVPPPAPRPSRRSGLSGGIKIPSK